MKINWSINLTDITGARKVFKTHLGVVTAAELFKYLKKKFLKRGVDVFINKAGEISYSISSVLGKITTKEFEEKAIEYIDRRYRWLIEERFEQGSRIWKPLKKKSIEKRKQRIKQGWKGSVSSPPLTFTGRLKKAWTTSNRITDFTFFSKASFEKGYLKFKPLELTAGWITSEQARSLEQSGTYFSHSTLRQPKFFHLGIYHSKLGRQIFPSRDIVSIRKGDKGYELKFKPWWKQTVYKKVIKPFIKTDFKRLLQLYAIFGSGITSNRKIENNISTDLISQAVKVLEKQGLFSGEVGQELKRDVEGKIIPKLKKSMEKYKYLKPAELAKIIRQLLIDIV